MFFPAFVVTVEAKQPPRRVLASRRLLFSDVRVPRLDPAPRRKRGAGFKTRGKKAASVGRRPRERRLVRLLRRFCAPCCLGKKLEIAIRVLKTQSSCGEALAAEPSTGEWL